MPPTSKPLVLAPGEGSIVEMGPLERIVFKGGSSATSDAFDLFEVTTQPGGGPPEHLHHNNDEAYYVIEGALQVKLGGQLFTATTGSYFFVPRGTPHTFGNTSAEPARFLVMITPGGMQGYFEQLGPLLFGPPNQAEIARILAQYSAETIGPPITG
jgi:quercetin dioxygenase-like cupin family protein